MAEQEENPSTDETPYPPDYAMFGLAGLAVVPVCGIFWILRYFHII